MAYRNVKCPFCSRRRMGDNIRGSRGGSKGGSKGGKEIAGGKSNKNARGGRMGGLGVMECSRCMLAKLQKQAGEDKQMITLRKSLYGLKPHAPGIDVYIHPKSVEIPSNHKIWHNMDIASWSASAMLLDENDPDRYLWAWFQEIPPKCECRMMGGDLHGKKII